MASTNRPLDESTATLVAPDDHLPAKDLLSTPPTTASTVISSGTVSDEEPSTPEPLAADVLCGWPHAHGANGKIRQKGTNESGWPHLDDAKNPPVGATGNGESGGWPPGDDNKPDPAKWHKLNGTTGSDGTDSPSKDDDLVSAFCGWPNNANGLNGSTAGQPGTGESGWPQVDDDDKNSAAKNFEREPPVGATGDGSGGWPHPGDDTKPDPAKWHTLKSAAGNTAAQQGTRESGWPQVDDDDAKDQAVKHSQGLPAVGLSDNGSDLVPGDSNSPDPAKLHPGNTDSASEDESGWPRVDDDDDDAKEQAAKNSQGRPRAGVPDNGSDFMPIPKPGDSSGPDPAKWHALKGTDKASTDATSNNDDESFSVQGGWPSGNSSKPDPAKLQLGNGTGGAGTDATSNNNDSFSALGGWPSGNSSKPDPSKLQTDRDSGNVDQTQPETAGPPQRRTPGTFGPEGQPPWGVKNLAAIASPEGQPPWGIKNLGAAAAVNAKSVVAEGPEGQPPWGVKNLAVVPGGVGPEGQPPWGVKNGPGNESAKSDDGARDDASA